MPHLPRVPAFPIAGERSIITAAGAALKIPAKEKASPLIGSFAPEIVAKDHLGRDVSLHATIELGRPIVLYFFPLAGSPHCTKEICSFRDAVGTSPIFNDLNAVVIGISQDPPARSKRFVDEHHLGFRILHDQNREIMNAWGVGRGLLGLIDGRCTFVIDHEGIVRAMLDGVWDYQGHRDFAEKWLCRIEHELSGRERFYMEHDADDSVAVDETTRNVRVVYGSATPARGIASAPRHGAATTAGKDKDRPRRPSTAASKSTSQSRDSPLSIASEANRSGSLMRSKSRKNLKNWLRSPPTATYDEPLHVDYKVTNRSLDNVTRDAQMRTKLAHPVRAASSTDRIGARIRTLRLEDSADTAQTQYDARSPRSREGSGSGSGWASPSSVSARSVSTGETSHTAEATRDSAAVAAPKQQPDTEIGAPRRRIPSDVGNGHPPSALPTARSSSLIKKKESRDGDEFESSTDSRASALSAADGTTTIYANRNIARMPLLPSSTVDSAATVLDRRSRRRSNDPGASADSNYTINGNSSLPVPPRPAARVAAAAAARLARYANGSSPSTSSHGHNGVSGMVAATTGAETPRRRGSQSGDEEGYATDRATIPPTAPRHHAGGFQAPSPTPSSSSSTHSQSRSRARRILPPQSPYPTKQLPDLPTSVSPSNSFTPSTGAYRDERRHSNTPSLTPSSAATGSEYDYSPSLAGSTHTFGGLEE